MEWRFALIQSQMNCWMNESSLSHFIYLKCMLYMRNNRQLCGKTILYQITEGSGMWPRLSALSITVGNRLLIKSPKQASDKVIFVLWKKISFKISWRIIIHEWEACSLSLSPSLALGEQWGDILGNVTSKQFLEWWGGAA